MLRHHQGNRRVLQSQVPLSIKMGKKLIIPKTLKNHHQKTPKPLKLQKNTINDKDNNNILSSIKVVPPKVYIIDKSSFKSKVQQLTGHVISTAQSLPPAPETIVDPAFTDLYSFSGSSMNDFAGYSFSENYYSQTDSPESLSFSSLDCTLEEAYNPSNELFSFDDLESWILDVVPPEPEVSIYDYELSGLYDRNHSSI